jgi:hypothetical protein
MITVAFADHVLSTLSGAYRFGVLHYLPQVCGKFDLEHVLLPLPMGAKYQLWGLISPFSFPF